MIEVGLLVLRQVFSLFDMDGFFRNAGAMRVNEEASRKLAEVLEDNGKEIMVKARIYAKHAGRRSITKKDVMLAAKHVTPNH